MLYLFFLYIAGMFFQYIYAQISQPIVYRRRDGVVWARSVFYYTTFRHICTMLRILAFVGRAGLDEHVHFSIILRVWRGTADELGSPCIRYTYNCLSFG
jgi:hypothetical protein